MLVIDFPFKLLTLKSDNYCTLSCFLNCKMKIDLLIPGTTYFCMLLYLVSSDTNCVALEGHNFNIE